MARLFGTDGVRGVANREPMTPQTVMRLGFAAGLRLRKSAAGAKGAGKTASRLACVVGRDTRISGEMLENALAAGLNSAGVDVLRAGVLPTPGVAFLAADLGVIAGAMISASHNPFEDNGVKFFSANGQKLTEAEEDEIESTMNALADGGFARHQSGIEGGALGICEDVLEARERYCRQAKEFFGEGRSLSGMKIVLDCANGASHVTSPQVLRSLGAEVVTIHDRPDGRNINDRCGSLHIDELQKAVRERGAHVGISHDGDADRALLADEKGQLVDGDFILGISARYLKARGKLPGDALVTTVMSNLGLEVAMKKLGIKVVKTQVGDRYVQEVMLREGFELGGEQSGHVILGRRPTGDGLLTALEVLKIMVDEKQPLSELHSFLSRFPQILLNVRVREKVELTRIPGLDQAVAGVERELGDEGRVVLRYSGTEPVARVMVEGRLEAEVRRHAELLASTIREGIGAS